MTKRRLSLYVLIIGIMVWSGPYFVGKYIETKYQILANRFSEFQGTKIEPVSYERHWRYSVAKTKVTFTDLAWQQVLSMGQNPWSALDNIPKLELMLEHKISHGPMIKGSKSWLDWTFARANVHSTLTEFDLLKEKLPQQALSNLISITSSMDLFDGELRIFLDGQPVPSLEWQGLEGQWTLNSGFTELQALVSLPKLKVRTDKLLVDISGLTFKTQRERIDEHVWQGVGQLSVQELNYQDKVHGQELFLSQAQWLGQLDTHLGIAKTRQAIDVEFLNYNASSYGPCNLEFSLESIPSDVLQVIHTLLADMPSDNRLSYIFLNDKVLASLPRFLAQRPSLSVNKLTCQTPEGMIEGRFEGAIGGKQAFQITQPQAVFASSQIELHLSVPKPLFERSLQEYFKKATSEPSLNSEEAAIDYSLQTIQSWLAKGYISEEQENYLVHLWVDKGALHTTPPAQ